MAEMQLADLKAKLLRLEEFAGCAFAAEPRLYSYKLARRLDFAALLLDRLNAPVLAIADKAPAKTLFTDYPRLKYIVVLPARGRQAASVFTASGSFPLAALLEGREAASAEKKRSTGEGAPRGEAMSPARAALFFAALLGALLILLLLLLLAR